MFVNVPATWRVAVVYFIEHREEAVRPGEDVPGLWEGEAPQRGQRRARNPTRRRRP